jgi:hypothetical protein
MGLFDSKEPFLKNYYDSDLEKNLLYCYKGLAKDIFIEYLNIFNAFQLTKNAKPSWQVKCAVHIYNLLFIFSEYKVSELLNIDDDEFYDLTSRILNLFCIAVFDNDSYKKSFFISRYFFSSPVQAELYDRITRIRDFLNIYSYDRDFFANNLFDESSHHLRTMLYMCFNDKSVKKIGESNFKIMLTHSVKIITTTVGRINQ